MQSFISTRPAASGVCFLLTSPLGKPSITTSASGSFYFRKWKLEGVFEEVMDTLHSLVRKQAGRQESPSLGIMDSRSVKTSHHVDSERGIDGNKKIKGRKEHIIVDTLGLPLAVAIHEANLHDSKARAPHKP